MTNWKEIEDEVFVAELTDEDIIRGRDYADLGEYGSFRAAELTVDLTHPDQIQVRGQLGLLPKHLEESVIMPGTLDLEVEPYYLHPNEEYHRYPETPEELAQLSPGQIFHAGWRAWSSMEIPEDWEF